MVNEFAPGARVSGSDQWAKASAVETARPFNVRLAMPETSEAVPVSVYDAAADVSADVTAHCGPDASCVEETTLLQGLNSSGPGAA